MRFDRSVGRTHRSTRKVDKVLLRRCAGANLAGNSAASKHDDAIRVCENLHHLGRDQKDSVACRGKTRKKGIHVAFRPFVDTACGLIADKNPGSGLDAASEYDLLLIAPAQPHDGNLAGGSLYCEACDLTIDSGDFSPTVDRSEAGESVDR
jgi:hypothetical protein